MHRKFAFITFPIFASIMICHAAENNSKITLFSYSLPESPLCNKNYYQYGSQKRESEDRLVIQDEVPNQLIAAVFDGHGGSNVARYLEKHWVSVLKAEIEKIKANSGKYNLEDAFKNACNTLDRQVQNIPSGSTLCSVMIQNGIVHIANVGDSRLIVVNTDGSVGFATQDHTADNLAENERLTKLSAYIIQDQDEKRIYFDNGNIRPSRVIGDYDLDPTSKILSPDPDYFQQKLTPDNLAIIIATDGLWDIFENEKVAQVVFDKNASIDNIAEHLCYLAKHQGSEDDITVIVKYLQ